MRRQLLLTTVLSSMLLAGCASWFEGSSQFQPTPLANIKPLQALDVKWSLQQAGPASSFLPVYDSGNVVSADAEGRIRSVDALSGRVQADVALKRALASGVAVSGDVVLVGSADAKLLAVDRKSGKIVWQQPLTSLMLEAPQIAGDIVVVRTNDARLTGFSLADGKQQWSVGNVLPQLTVRNNGSMRAVGKEAVMVGQAGGRLDIVNPQTGNTLWQGAVATPRGATELERVTDVTSRPAYDGGQVCAVAYQGRVACFEARNGSLLWGREVSSSRGLAMDARNVYVTAEDGSIWAYDRQSGRNLWKNDELKYRNVSGPAMIGRFVLVVDGEGYAHLLSNESGSIVGRSKIGTSGPVNQPVSLGSSALIQGQDGRLAMLNLG
ncbi:outer membrane protein assembly factor BamB [Chromobacterium subtsugae]|uniref:Outer membrane protein assembly factor BamB n=1 Tax=Chromobacterium subtsugae TaxID=251747 RepID=A0ABS7FJE6_9NEIS|nr:MULTISPECIES: outer membrane protein assembly factor BamB [Chromobacterium]KUM03307.1 outer membrane protein assembly factor BamB [Chromobacterium subtsugae]KZE86803.1 outer membrane protein assembly factor BamB [Chromobacterium sp. F49]MBW7569104.1 outer membrane protein assembly factor BamB [Chromobacterium subtsugae]MBW8290174.1 outer membrane protein assembly factor BamB [Chromobacterium subtsugae]OBU86654.1 lipoprotein [Chromobacterium subtsugae]